MAHREKMQKMFVKGNYEELSKFCRERLDVSPEDVDTLFFHAVSLNALERYSEAGNLFRKLFNITQDKLFLSCEAIPEFLEFKREDALKSLEKAIDGEAGLGNLFIAFEVAFLNGEFEMARKTLYLCFRNDSEKTVAMLQEFFEMQKIADPEKRIMVVGMLATLKRILGKNG